MTTDRPTTRLLCLRAIAADDLLAGEALDVETRLLRRQGRRADALRRAAGGSVAAMPGPQDFARLGNVLGDMDRHAEAAAAYGEAISSPTAARSDESLWTLRLLRAPASSRPTAGPKPRPSWSWR